MPSPSWKRTKPVSAMSVPASLAAAATTSATGVLLSITNSWVSSACSLRNLARPPSTIFSAIACGLRLSFAFSIALALDQRGGQIVGGQSERVRGRDVHRDLLAERLQSLGRGRALERDQHADLAEGGRD